MSDVLPTVIGRYEILGRLGKGAMGEVYHARDRSIGREVALKTYRIGPQSEEHELALLRKRLMREASNAGRLSHPNVVTVYDVMELQQGGGFYIVMEYVDGESLADHLAEVGHLTLPEALPLFDQIASAVDHLHDRGLVHRDLKPANLLVADNGLIKITDFGVAQPGDPVQTQETTVFGTPHYMAPEQIQGRPADRRTDVFALGVLLYEMLTGGRPFRGETVAEVTHNVLYEVVVPPAEHLGEHLSQRVEAVLERALHRSPEERFSSAGAMANALRGETPSRVELDAAKTERLPVSAFRTRARRWRRVAVQAGVMALLLAGGFWFGTVALTERAETADPADESAARAAGYRQILNEGRRLMASGDPDSAVVLFDTAAGLADDPAAARQLGEAARAEIDGRGVEQKLLEAREALAARRFDDAIAAARELLGSDTAQAEALDILAEVEDALGRPPPAAARTSRPAVSEPRSIDTPTTTSAPAPSTTPSSAGAVAGDREAPPTTTPVAMLSVTLDSRAPRGVLTLFVGDQQVLFEPFTFTSKRWFRRVLASGRIEAEVQIPANVAPLKLVLARYDQPPVVLTFQTSFPDGSRRRLQIDLPKIGKPNVTLD